MRWPPLLQPPLVAVVVVLLVLVLMLVLVLLLSLLLVSLPLLPVVLLVLLWQRCHRLLLPTWQPPRLTAALATPLAQQKCPLPPRSAVPACCRGMHRHSPPTVA